MNRSANLQPATHGRQAGRSGRFMASGRLAWLARTLVCSLAIAAGLTGGSATAEDAAPLDFQVKAAFLVNFPKYVEWPSTALAETNSPITVGIIGDDNVANEFGKMIEGRNQIAGHPILLKRFTRMEEIGRECQILFIAKSERQRLPAILEKVKGEGVLTVGENEDFLENGGIINLVPRDRRIHLQVNLSAANRARLRISSRLLVVADVVKGKAE